ncbi:DUF7674 family protein [Candidatus Odyssella acanthamoebae]|uniref:DUF7674 domain-containing protein n=1 Tax=Candidatus Odyssella acanthamoebae TaxID=91604 RepID=A0A077AX53_9PROT|nr:hypothetical protein [Candidatus Paracaedibacter acanthamoebae]AIK96198.1 hypothetical protein ID47_04720 [Candidatus Paracaedibacter acanthamoebae]
MSRFDFSKYCNDKLFATFPKLFKDDRYKKIIHETLGDPELTAHTIYEDVFFDYVFSLISEDSLKNKAEIKKAFELIEELANHEDIETRCVVDVSFIEPLLAKLKPTRDIEKYLGSKSLEMAREIGASMFGFNPITWEKEED